VGINLIAKRINDQRPPEQIDPEAEQIDRGSHQ